MDRNIVVPKIPGRGWESLHPMSKIIYKETYFRDGEDYESWLEDRCSKFANDDKHKERLKTYIRNRWFHFSTPPSSGAGLPISCYVSHIPDNREGIFDGYLEGFWLGAEGGGRGVNWNEVGGLGRPIGVPDSKLSLMTWNEIQKDKDIAKSAGIVPFLGVSDRATFAISQANVRRSTEAAYIFVDHTDVKHFIDIRLETGDRNRRTPNLHHGIVLTDKFMEAVRNLEPWDLYDRKTGKVAATIDAFDLFMDIIECRKTETGEPYLLFIDNVNRNKPEEYRRLNLDVTCSNICTEIMLYTAPDTTAVCCLGSANLEHYDEYKDILDVFVADCLDALDNILTYFLKETENYEGTKKEAFKRARKSIIDSRDVGLGTMGWHSLLQKKHIPFESPMAVALNKQIFKAIRVAADEYQEKLCTEHPELICPMSKRAGTKRRNVHCLATAPTMGISTLTDLCSSGIEPWLSNTFVKKIPQGTFSIKNKYLERTLIAHAEKVGIHNIDDWLEEQWSSIIGAKGSVQHLEFLDAYTKDVYKTAFEINPMALLTQMSDRAPLVDQGVSNNIFLPATITREELYQVHFLAWTLGIKSLYYLRSQPESDAKVGKSDRKAIVLEDDACVACT